MRFLWWLPILAFATAANQAQQSKKDTQASISGANANPIERSHEEKVFAYRVQEYVRMQKDLEGSGSAARNSTKDSEQIADRQHALAGRIAAARPGSRAV